MVRGLVLVLVLGGCRQLFGIGDPTLGSGDSGIGDSVPDGGCGWPFVPSNFDPCALPSAVPLPALMNGKLTIDSDAMIAGSTVIQQPGGSSVLVLHLSGFTLAAGDVVSTTGSRAVIFAVDTGAVVDGNIYVESGTPIGCDAAIGGNSNGGAAGGGGGGGGGAADNGAIGGDGDGGSARGIGGTGGTKHGTTTLVPLVAGCPGQVGGVNNGLGTPATGGLGGGAFQLSSKSGINFSGLLMAAGSGGAAGPTKAGGGGGGAGGGILLEAPSVLINTGATVCADGGSGGEGGNSTTKGAPGTTSPCTKTMGAVTGDLGTGGNGGDGGFGARLAGLGQAGVSQGGGGGGGGAVGWIHLRGTTGVVIEPSTIITPDPK